MKQNNKIYKTLIKKLFLYSCISVNKRYNIPNGPSRETGSKGYTSRRQTKQQHNAICVGHQYLETTTTNVNKTWALLPPTRGKDVPNTLCGIVTDFTKGNSDT